LSDKESQDNLDEETSVSDLEAQLSFNLIEVSKWIERLPTDVKKALQKDGGDLLPKAEAENFRFPESLVENGKELLDKFGNGGRLWLLAKLFHLSWPHSGLLTKDVFEIDGVGELLQSDLMRIRDPISIRTMRFLLSCKEFRDTIAGLSRLPEILRENKE
jgi:hypothetical protein